jgi:hypothetical protein
VNYQRGALGQKESGHISPLAAYNAASDRFLILDVAAYKYPPVWVICAGFMGGDECRRLIRRTHARVCRSQWIKGEGEIRQQGSRFTSSFAIESPAI